MGVGRGFGKLLLFGEHAAVYGHPAVGIRLPEYLDVTLEAGGDDIRVPGIDEVNAHLITRAARSLGIRNAIVRLAGDLPIGVGLGSSAAFCTALLRAAGGSPPVGGGSDDRELWRRAHELEHIFHGTPSGIDTGLSIYPGASTIRTCPPDLPHRAAVALPGAWIVAAAIGRSRTTAELVAGVKSMRETDAASVDATLGRLGELAAIVSEREPDATALGSAASEARSLLAALGVVTPELDRALDALDLAGSLGSKPSGAGGGGAFFGVFASDDAAVAAGRALRSGLSADRIELRYLSVIPLAH